MINQIIIPNPPALLIDTQQCVRDLQNGFYDATAPSLNCFAPTLIVGYFFLIDLQETYQFKTQVID